MPRIEKLEGRDHFVVPMVMLTVGNHSGSNGEVFYPADEFERTVNDWNGRPVVVYHPELNGRGVSAGDPQITNRFKVGVIFNTQFDGHKLTADAWIDRDRVAQVDSRVYQAVMNNRQMEVSTGLVMDIDRVNRNGDTPTARNHRPDHLALLPDKVGACSLAKGCGLSRNNEADVVCEEDTLEIPSIAW